MVIEIASVNKIQLKSISTVADPRGVTGQKLEEIFLSVWQVKVKKKRRKRETYLKNVPYPKRLLFFHVLATFF